MSLDVLGAEGLAAKYIVLRVRSIDADRLKQKVGGMAGASLPWALPLIDQAPEVVLRTALPLAAKKVQDDYGVTLDWDVSDAPPEKGQALPSRFGAGFVMGAAGCAAVWLAFKHLF